MRMNEEIRADVEPMKTEMITAPMMRLDSDRFMVVFLSDIVFVRAAGTRRPGGRYRGYRPFASGL